MQDNRMKRPRFKWLVALLLVCAVSVSVLVPALAVLNFTTDADAPDLKIVSTLTDDGQYLEMGLNVNSEEEQSFQSTGVILTYDPAMLTPVIWGVQTDDEGNALPPTEIIPTTVTADNAATAWTEATVLPTKGADELSGKLAKAVIVDGKGYLFISAEAAVSIPLSQPLPDDENAEGALTAPTATASGLGISYIAQAAAATPQATTVRFKVNEKVDGETTALYTAAELAASVDVLVYDDTTPDATAKTLLDTSVLAGIDPEAEKYAGVSYIADNTDYTTAGFDRAANLAFVWVQSGVTVNTGGGGGVASADDFIALTLFDWDNTLIGTKIVPRSDDAEEQAALVTTAFQEIQTEYADVFASHAGYDFGCWIPYDSETPTAYGKWVNPLNVNIMSAEDLPRPEDEVTAQDVTGSMILKAAYQTNENCALATALERQYEITISDAGRFSTDFIYPVTFRIARGDAPRAIEPALRVQMTTNGVTTYSLTPLTGADVEYVQIALAADLTGGVDEVVYTVVDIYGQSNWKDCGVRTNTDITKLERGTVEKEPVGVNGAMFDVFQDGGYPRMCIVGSFNNALESYAADPSVAIGTALSQIGLTEIRRIGISCSGISTIRKNLYKEWRIKNTVDGTETGALRPSDSYVDLTYEEIKTIVQTGSLN